MCFINKDFGRLVLESSNISNLSISYASYYLVTERIVGAFQ